MTITLARRTKQKVKRTKFLPLCSTFYTVDGPAVRTIWLDRDKIDRQPFEVVAVDASINRVRYASKDWDRLDNFTDFVNQGRYVLVGVQPTALSHTAF